MSESNELNGLLLIDKPAGWTSFDVVAKVRGVLSREIRNQHEVRGFCRDDESAKWASSAKKRTVEYSERATQPNDKASASQKNRAASSTGGPVFRCKCRVKVGHTGTLDPAATGLLVLAIGKSTKQIQNLTKLDKTYETTVQLGAISTTDDVEGEIEQLKVSRWPDEAEVKKALNSFLGEIEQVPPAFSAIKVDGKRAYKLAREGKEVKIASRKVTIRSIDSVSYNQTTHLVSFTAAVSSGTYIRSLARDIGTQLSCGAFMASLRRTQVGDYSIQLAIPPNALNYQGIQNKLIQAET